MEASAVLSALAQEKRMYNLLNEAMDLSRQLAEAVDRDDQVTIRMLISMRGEPLEKLTGVRRALEGQRDSLPPAEARRLADLLNGGAASEQAEEKALAAQVAANKRIYQQLLAIDESVNRKLGRDKSIYNK